MKKYIIALGKVKITIIFSVMAEIVSFGVTYLISVIFRGRIDPLGIGISLIAPLCFAPWSTYVFASLVIRIHNLEQKMWSLLQFDPLTETYSRRGFYEAFDVLNRLTIRSRSVMTVLYLDLDHFKKINDNFGHKGGDFVLKEFCYYLNRKKRDSDILARVGGEEFVFLLPGTDEAGGKTFAEKIRKGIEEQVLYYENQEIRYTMSIGLYSYFPSECNLNIEQILHNADQALYVSKKTGRNKVSVFVPND